jgi:acyl-CoA reductase-like NAD-dependent aldehyde dehydrogenase
MGLIENYDVAIASMEQRLHEAEYQAKICQARAYGQSIEAMHARDRAARIREQVAAMREPRDELAKLYPPEPPSGTPRLA